MKKTLFMRKRIEKMNESLGSDFNIGTIVTCNADYCYISYSPFIKRHSKYDLHWAYKCFPTADSKYKIIGVYDHVLEDVYDKCDFVVVVEDIVTHQIFLMGELGIMPYSTSKKGTR